MNLGIIFKFPNLAKKFWSAREEISLFIAANVQANRGMLFDSEGDYNGRKKWAPLKLRVGQILSDRGTLRKSLAPSNPDGHAGPNGTVTRNGNVVTIGTTLGYARLMNDGTVNMPGGVLRPTHAKALKIPLPSGKSATPEAKKLRKGAKTLTYEVAEGVKKKGKFIFRAWVKIPPRPFDDWNEQDQKELNEALAGKIGEVLSR